MSGSPRALAEFPLSNPIVAHLTATGRTQATRSERALLEPVLAERDVWVTGAAGLEEALHAVLVAAVDRLEPTPKAPQLLVVLAQRDPPRARAAFVGRLAAALHLQSADVDAGFEPPLLAQVVVGSVGRVREAISRAAIVPGCVRGVVLVQPELMLANDALHDAALILERCGRATRTFVGGGTELGPFAARWLRAPELVALPLPPEAPAARPTPTPAPAPRVEAPDSPPRPPPTLAPLEPVGAVNAALAVATLAADGPVLVLGAEPDLAVALDQLGVDAEVASLDHGRRLATARRLRRGELAAAIVNGALSAFSEARPAILHVDTPDDETRERREQGLWPEARVHAFVVDEAAPHPLSVEALIDATEGVHGGGWSAAVHELLHRDDAADLISRLARLALRTARVEDQRAADAESGSDEPRRRRRKRRRIHG